MTLRLVEPLDDSQLNTAYSDILSPLAWDLGHIANFEELWLVQTIGEREPMDGDLGRFYDAIENPRKTRNELPILRGGDLRRYMSDVRERTMEVLDQVELDDTDDPLCRAGFVYELILAHEHQHNETMLQLLQMVERYEPEVADPVEAERVGDGPEMVLVDGGTHVIGDDGTGFAYDNEQPDHTVELESFEIDRTPVTNEAFTRFLEETGAEAPLYWERDGEGGWTRTTMGSTQPVKLDHPVVHVDHVAAAAFAEWAGKRLPTEFEWEAAAHGADPGQANLDCLAFETAPAGAYSGAPSKAGAVQMLGDVWEWTSSDFQAYPGFRAFPYDQYSKVFFGSDHKVLRGGSWATRRGVIRTTFRNWDLPIRRQIFSGFRCARSV